MLKKQTLPPGVLEATRDRWGRTVLLSAEAMEHIAKGHPEMDGCELAIMTAVEIAPYRCRGVKKGRFVKGREVLYAQNLGPGDWLRVVVAYAGSSGQVITAYGDKDGPEEADRI